MHFLDVSSLWENSTEMAPKMSGGFFPTNPDLADILGRMDFDFDNVSFSPFHRIADVSTRTSD